MFVMVPEGPYRSPGRKPDLSAFLRVFGSKPFRSAAFGYFGHMWELYAFWAFIPVLLHTYANEHPATSLNIPVLSFLVIGIGSVACIISGYLSLSYGAKRVAATALFLSCLCCILSPWMLSLNSAYAFILFLFFWGMAVIADSPLFSTLVATNALPELRGTALTIVNCIGFSVTIISIQVLTWLSEKIDPVFLFTLLALGPVLGLVAMYDQKLKSGLLQ
jgi:MFS family permease